MFFEVFYMHINFSINILLVLVVSYPNFKKFTYRRTHIVSYPYPYYVSGLHSACIMVKNLRESFSLIWVPQGSRN